jgi:heme exporter protein A
LLDVVNLECVRGDRPLFRDLSFSLKPGELLHIRGANGSGKTTLLRTLCGLSRPAAGAIRWHGSDIHDLGDEYRGQLAYVGHANGIQGDLTPPENLRAAACLAGADARVTPAEALQRLALAPYAAFPAKVLSQGQKRRLALARLAVLNKPLWVLDEPLSALDTRSTDLMTGLLTEHLSRGGLVVMTSHQEFSVAVSTVLQIHLDP